jgi:uncharacterized membrane protein YqaE (UPF0057 family)
LVSLAEIVIAIILVGVGFLVISLLATLLGFLPAIIVAVIVYFVAGHSLLYAGIAFVVIAFLWALVRHK